MPYNYTHKVNYYETDRMGVTHHSNYIRFMEEARVRFLDDIGYSYAKLEEMGIGSPVIGVNCEYKKTTTFDDDIIVTLSVKQYKGSRLVIEYIMKNKDGDIVLTGETSHCFINKDGHFARLRRDWPQLDAMLKKLADEYAEAHATENAENENTEIAE